MRTKWTDDELKYFRKGIKEVKQTEETNENSWWILFGVVVLMEVIVIAKIVSLFQVEELNLSKGEMKNEY